MSDSIDSNISPTGFGQFSDGTTNSESTPGDKYSRQVGDSVTVQDGNKSTLLNGWSNTVTAGFEFKTVGGTYISTIGGGGLTTIAGADFKQTRGFKVDFTGGKSYKATYGSDYEVKHSNSYRHFTGTICEAAVQDKVDVCPAMQQIADAKTAIINSVTNISETRESVCSYKGDHCVDALIEAAAAYEARGGASATLSSSGPTSMKGSTAEVGASGVVSFWGSVLKLC